MFRRRSQRRPAANLQKCSADKETFFFFFFEFCQQVAAVQAPPAGFPLALSVAWSVHVTSQLRRFLPVCIITFVFVGLVLLNLCRVCLRTRVLDLCLRCAMWNTAQVSVRLQQRRVLPAVYLPPPAVCVLSTPVKSVKPVSSARRCLLIKTHTHNEAHTQQRSLDIGCRFGLMAGASRVFPDVLNLLLTYSPLHADLNSLWCFSSERSCDI